jgi:hypothetical protein
VFKIIATKRPGTQRAAKRSRSTLLIDYKSPVSWCLLSIGYCLAMHCSPCTGSSGARARSGPYRSPCTGSSGARARSGPYRSPCNGACRARASRNGSAGLREWLDRPQGMARPASGNGSAGLREWLGRPQGMARPASGNGSAGLRERLGRPQGTARPASRIKERSGGSSVWRVTSPQRCNMARSFE